MASSTARAFQTVKPHIPLIRFRGGNLTKANSTVLASSNQSTTETSPPTPKVTNIAAPGATLESHQLSRKYARIPLSIEEMEYIQRGGPD
ncbi:alpha-ketoglutarate dehydrogenase component 4-like isoform X2 [Ostrea edulis]|uniref:alpha-ketoglutarate dehydrogenase component 4-like isoform X2 n=1 Tax=Ostrea edulis TaxID=37623 RepID=UPI0024AFB31B|nr:alpha-ketoglutarate dehydrogenase component 4-like isoform X2 [Ostrea edulis]